MIRRYKNDDKEQIVDLLQRNTPTFFAPHEKKDLVFYLENEVEDYFVFEKENKIIGCGGINYFPKEETAFISWDIVHPDFQKKGIGSELLQFRLDHLAGQSGVKEIVVRTTQLTNKFYEKFGFKLEKTKQDYWGEGLDLYHLKRKNDWKGFKD